MIKYIISALTIYFLYDLILFIFQRKILFNTTGIPKKPNDYELNNIKKLNIKTFDGVNLLEWYSKPKLNQPLLLYFHGNSFDIGERSHRIKRYIDNGWDVILLAWRVYSGNKGRPSEKNLFIDEAMHNNLYDFDIEKEVISFNS